ncbi:MAG: hypothetical protein ABL996_26880, partial [Micropepsaceae bacterium]
LPYRARIGYQPGEYAAPDDAFALLVDQQTGAYELKHVGTTNLSITPTSAGLEFTFNGTIYLLADLLLHYSK